MSSDTIKMRDGEEALLSCSADDMDSAAAAAHIWSKVADRLREILSETAYNQYIAVIVPVSMDEDELHLGVADDFFAEFVSGTYGALIGEQLMAETGMSNFKITGGFSMPEEPIPLPVAETPGKSGEEDQKRETAVPKRLPGLLAKYSFDNFVVGDENMYAYSAARAVTEQPGIHNPLFIYGASGTGKTHLVVAAAHALQAEHPEMTIRYSSCEDVLNHYVESLRNQNGAEFRSYMRDVDVLIIDDIHQLAGKTQLQEQFFNTFNVLYSCNKQIILTCDRQPSEVQGLEPRLVSRFESGLTTEITAPGVETRLAILEALQDEQSISISPAVLTFIATNITANVRRLKGALFRLVAYASMMHCTIDMKKAEEILHKLIEEDRVARVVSMENIIQEVARHFELHVSELLGDRRLRNIAEPRMIAMYLARKLTNHSFPEIGAAFGKNHATIMNAMKKVPELCNANEDMRRSVELIERQLKK